MDNTIAPNIPVIPAQNPSVPATTAPAAATAPSTTVPSGPVAGNSSGLLQNFVLSRSALEGVGLRTPRNAGDTEILLAEARLVLEELGDENLSSDAQARGSDLRDKISTIAGAQAEIARTQAENIELGVQLGSVQNQLENVQQESSNLGEAQEQLQGQVDNFNTQIADINQQIADLPADGNPVSLIQQRTDIEAQRATVQTQLNNVNASLANTAEQASGLQAHADSLNGEIAQNESRIAFLEEFQASIAEILAVVADTETAPEEGEVAEVFAREENTQIDLRDILPELQELLEVDTEDAEIQEFITEATIGDEVLGNLLATTFGFSGSFAEALGVFFQSADLVELDLDSVARGNNKSQRLQIAI